MGQTKTEILQRALVNGGTVTVAFTDHDKTNQIRELVIEGMLKKGAKLLSPYHDEYKLTAKQCECGFWIKNSDHAAQVDHMYTKHQNDDDANHMVRMLIS